MRDSGLRIREVLVCDGGCGLVVDEPGYCERCAEEGMALDRQLNEAWELRKQAEARVRFTAALAEQRRQEEIAGERPYCGFPPPDADRPWTIWDWLIAGFVAALAGYLTVDIFMGLFAS
jgi:hypothetical protein